MRFYRCISYIIGCLLVCSVYQLKGQSELSEPTRYKLSLANNYFEQLWYDSAEYHYKMALENLEPETHPKLFCAGTNNYIETLWRNEKYALARQLAYQNLERCINYLGKDNPESGQAYLNLGIINFLTGFSGSTHEYYTKALDVFNENYGCFNDESAEVYEWLGAYHCSFSDSATARRYLFKALEIRTHNSKTQDYRSGNLYRYLGLFYKRYSKFDSALYYSNKAKLLFDKKFSEYNYNSIKCRNNIADVYEWFGEFDTALAIHNKSLELIAKSKSINRYPLMMTYFNISELYSNFGDFENALKYMQKVLKIYYPEIDENSVFSNPENVDAFVCAVTKVAMAYKSRYMKEIYKQNPNSNFKYLICSAQCGDLWNKLTTEMKKGITNIEELIFFEHLHNNGYMELADNDFLIYENTGDTAYLSKALTYLSINRNANQVFSDEQLEKKYLANVPESYFKSKNLLQKELNELLSRRLTVDKTDPTIELNVSIAEKKIQLDTLACNFKLRHPGLMSSVSNYKTVYLQAIIKKINDDQALIWYNEYCSDYIETPDSILILAFSENSVKYFKIDGNTTIDLIKQYQELLSGNPDDISGIDSAGYRLYSVLIKPVKDIISKRELIIIPSQHISMIPFDALPVEVNPNPARMIDNTIIWNEYSIVSFLQDDNKYKFNEKKVLAVAPRFNSKQKEVIALLTKRDTSLINLPGAKKECENIETLFDTKILYGDNATLQAFKTYCPDYKIIHLSTHAIPDRDNEETIRLVFSDYIETDKDGSIDLFDVLNLPVHADLVVLSACKTGVGKMSKGEGNINLAWAFKKAGAKSVLVSLWDANDYASSVIMPKFYKYLSDGMTKPEALHLAKLDFIKSSDELTMSPYFWAGFEYWGDGSSIVPKHENDDFLLYTLIIVGFSLISFIVYKRMTLSS